jgi:hypothetical protein
LFQVSQDTNTDLRGANRATELNSPITEAEERLLRGYSYSIHRFFKTYFYLLRSPSGIMWAAGNPELTAFVRDLWALDADVELMEAA